MVKSPVDFAVWVAVAVNDVAIPVPPATTVAAPVVVFTVANVAFPKPLMSVYNVPSVSNAAAHVDEVPGVLGLADDAVVLARPGVEAEFLETCGVRASGVGGERCTARFVVGPDEGAVPGTRVT